MAFNGFVGGSNIGSFLLQAISFGQCTMNNYSKIQARLLDASRQLKEATDEIKKYTQYMTDKEFESTMRQCEDAMQLVVDSLKEDAARKSFIVEVKKYQESKANAQDKVILSVMAMATVQSVSTRAKRREEKRIDEATNHIRLQRIDEFERTLTQTGSAKASTTHGSRQVPLPPPSPSPESRLGNEPNSPFRDLSTSNLNLIAGGETGDISLQRVSASSQ